MSINPYANWAKVVCVKFQYSVDGRLIAETYR